MTPSASYEMLMPVSATQNSTPSAALRAVTTKAVIAVMLMNPYEARNVKVSVQTGSQILMLWQADGNRTGRRLV
jgi:hypothetical protein